MRPALSMSAWRSAPSPRGAAKPTAMPPHIARQCTPPNRPASNAAPSASRSTGIAWTLWCVVVGQDVERRRLDVLELSAAHRPGEEQHGEAEQQQGDRDQGKQDVHAAPPRSRPTRSALSVTPSEEPAMPSAAQPGASAPLAASA